MDVTLQTERLVLRQPRMEDAEAIAAGLNSFAVAGNLARVPYPYAVQDARTWLRRQVPDALPGDTGFAITLDGESYLGQIGFHRDLAGTVLGYWLAEPYWGRGYMTEAGRAVVDWFFGTTDAEVIHSGVFDFNAASLNVQHKLGFVETGRSVKRCLARNADLGHIDTQLTRARWAEGRT
jgi:RimJ/RimL family protein N-acetyltransferase